MNKGTVKWFNNQKGYGFISDESGSDVFVHYSGLNMDQMKQEAMYSFITQDLTWMASNLWKKALLLSLK